MKNFISFILICIGFNAFAQLNEKSANPNITPYHDASEQWSQQQIKNVLEQSAWLQFRAQHPSWGARFNMYSKMPHRAMGEPIHFAAASMDKVATAYNFIQQELAGFEIPSAEFVLTRNNNDGIYHNVDFKQVKQNREVLFSRFTMRFAQNGDIILFGADVHPHIPDNLSASITPTQAKQFAENKIVTTIQYSEVKNDLKILPLPLDGKMEYRLVYEVLTLTKDNATLEGRYVSYVDARNGEVLYRDNEVHTIGFNVHADLYTSNLFSPSQNMGLPHLKVVDNSQTFYTDVNGNVTTLGATANPVITLEGRYIDVVTGQSGTVTPSFSPSVTVANSTINFPTLSPQPDIQHFTAYYHGNIVHDFMKSKMPASFTTMDNPLLCRVDRTDGSCNAFYNGTSINFYTTSNGCNAFSLVNTIVYHEYGHGISRNFWQANGSNFSNGAMGEGYSDAWAFFITDDPLTGRGSYINQPNSFIRRYDINPKIYPQHIIGEVHADGEIIAGAWWDTYQYWGDINACSQLFATSQNGLATGPNGAEGQVYFDILIDALQYDDNDANINNGTPNFNHITKGFADHGIYLLNNTIFEHTPNGIVNAGIPTTINTKTISDFPAFVGDADMVYRLKGTTASNSIAMTKVGQDFTVNFPAQNAGDIYEYYFKVQDNQNTYSIFSPKNAEFTITNTQRNLPYYLLVEYKVVLQELFDNGLPTGWTAGISTDNASKGQWTVGVPIPSFTNVNDSSTLVQTYYDRNGGGGCAFTANGTSATASVGQSDVDGGRTTLLSKVYDISAYDQPVLRYARWFSNNQGSNGGEDLWKAELNYVGSTIWYPIDRTYMEDVSWREQVNTLVKTAGTQIQVRFIATDSLQGSLVEAAVDAFEILDKGQIPTGVENTFVWQGKIFPNPSNGELNIQFINSGLASYAIVNVLGEHVAKGTINAKQNEIYKVDVSSIAQGFYFVKMQQDGKSYSQTLQIQH